MTRLVLACVLAFSVLFAEESSIEDLLSKYRDANELYMDTKQSRSGHLIVYSRSDLDKMQAYTLNDVLKTVRMFTLKSTRFGMGSLIKTPFAEHGMSGVRIFINSHELTSITSGTGLTQFGKMGLNHIDHIEIYQASNAVSFGGEPGKMTVKLYTKNPERENASVVQMSVDSKAGSRGQFIEAKSFDEYSYLANVDIGRNRYDDQHINNSELSKDGHRVQAYFNISKKDDFLLEAALSKEKYDVFSGFGSTVQDGFLDMSYNYLTFNKYFDKSLELTLSSAYEKVDLNNADFAGIRLFDNSISNKLEADIGSYTNSAKLEKRSVYGNNDILFGAQFKQRRLFLDEFKSGGVQKQIALGPKSLDMYMLFAEDTYSINQNHQITFGAKIDRYKNSFDKSSTENFLRLAYLGRLRENIFFKAFVQKHYSYPIFFQTTFSPLFLPNPDLKSSKARVAKMEVVYKKDKLSLTVGGGVSKSDRGVFFNSSKKMYENSHSHSDFGQIFLNAKYKFDADNKIEVEYFKAYKEGRSLSSDEGILVKVFSRIDRFDIYNELIYRSSYDSIDGTYIDAGYDYTAGVIYRYDKNIDIKLKGENLLDKASMTSLGGVGVPAVDRRVLLTLEYMF